MGAVQSVKVINALLWLNMEPAMKINVWGGLAATQLLDWGKKCF